MNNGARTVVIPDPTLDLNTVRMPENFAITLSKPARVGDLNIENLRQCILVGDGVLGGAYVGKHLDVSTAEVGPLAGQGEDHKLLLNVRGDGETHRAVSAAATKFERCALTYGPTVRVEVHKLGGMQAIWMNVHVGKRVEVRMC